MNFTLCLSMLLQKFCHSAIKHLTSHSVLINTGTCTTKPVHWVRFFNSQNEYLFSHQLHQLKALCTANDSGCTPVFCSYLISLRSLFFTIMKEHIKHYCYLYYEAVIYVSTTILSWNCKQKKLENNCLCQAGSLNFMYENPLYCGTEIWVNFMFWECTDLALTFKV